VDADLLALDGDLHHSVKSRVVLEGAVEGEWGLLASFGKIKEELAEAILTDKFKVKGGRGGRDGGVHRNGHL
jgi:hypothetical protein